MGFELVLEGGGDIEPGQEIRLGLAVTNTSDVVDEVQLSVLGDAQGWATVHPASIASGGPGKVVAPHCPFGWISGSADGGRCGRRDPLTLLTRPPA